MRFNLLRIKNKVYLADLNFFFNLNFQQMRSFFIAVWLLYATNLSAQIPDSLICPNFTGVDINGGSHTLYNYLDSGYTVFIDVSVTWCPPCWSYHTSGVLENFYNQYGPNGSNKARVLFIEGEATNTRAQLEGVKTNNSRSGLTLGNWISGTPYPIIDDASIANRLQVVNYPTFFAVFPNRQIIQIRDTRLSALTNQLNNTISANGTNNMSVLQFNDFNEYFCKSKTFAPQLKVQNLGFDTVKTAQILLKINNNVVETKALSGLSLRKYDTLVVNFNNVTVTDNANITFDITTVNNIENTAIYRRSATYSVLRGSQTDSDSITIELKTDQFPEETYWKIVDQTGLKIAEGGNPLVRPNSLTSGLNNFGNYQLRNKIYTQKLVLKRNTCYDIYLWDGNADGLIGIYDSTAMVVGTVGYLKIWNGATNLFNLGNTTKFSEIKRSLERSGVSAAQAIDELSDLSIKPSPVSETLTLDFTLLEAKNLTISVVNLLGQTLKTLRKQLYTEGGNTVQITTNNLINGLYFIQIKEENAMLTRKFIVQH
jgi:Secretion system C-terminal sorting domain